MKVKYYLMFSFLLFVGLSMTAQEENAKKEKKSKSFLDQLSVTPQIGFLHYWGDLSTKDGFESLTDSEENELGYGLLVNYSLTDYLSISGGVLGGKLSGTDYSINTANASSNTADYGLGIQHRTNLFEITLPRVDLNLTRLIFRDNVKFFNKFSFNLFASHGLVSFDSKIYAANQEDVNVKYFPDRGRTGKTNEGVTSVGSSISYIITDRFDIGLETSIRNVYNDKLDAWPSEGSSNDKYSFTALNITYHIRGRDYVRKDFDLEKKVIAEESSSKDDGKELKDQEEPEAMAEQKEVEPVEEVVEEEPKQQLEEIEEVEPIQPVEMEEEKAEPIEKPKKKEEKLEEEIPPFELYEGSGNFVSVAAFRTFERAQVKAKQLKGSGESPIIVQNRIGTWYIVAIDRYDTLEEALPRMKKARSEGYTRSWVLVKP